MEIKSIDAGSPSIVPEIGRTKKGGKNVQKKEQVAAQISAKHQDAQSAPAATNFETIAFKAFFAIDENKNVVIRIKDAEGNVVKQIPPAEYLKMAETLLENSKTLFHLEA
ncbi:MAG: flagellar protein FlaG [Candidatus Manganitrophus sp. SB1]|nr:flagellar protein FlaG [Candidatus Manganitrophus morganii]